MITTALAFDHRARTPKGKPGPIEVRVTIDRKSYYVNTGVRVLRSEWDGYLVINRFDSDELNERLMILRRKADAVVNERMAKNLPFDVKEVKNALFRTVEQVNGKGDDFLEWCEGQIAQLNIKEGSRKHYSTMLTRLREFGKINTWQDLTVENIYQWDAFLRSLEKQPKNPFMKMKGEKISVGAVHNYHKYLKALIYRAERFGILEKNPYVRLKGEFPKGDKQNVEYLTEEEMQRVVDCHPLAGTAAARARDLFVFQMYTGLSYADTQDFDFSKYKEVDGKYMMVGERIKTGVAYVSQLLPPAVEVLRANGWCVPKISNQKYNEALHQIGEVLGISTPMHSHLARHTFATYMLRNGVKIENVSKMLGHTNITQTQRYAKVLEQSVCEEFSMIERKMNGE